MECKYTFSTFSRFRPCELGVSLSSSSLVFLLRIPSRRLVKQLQDSLRQPAKLAAGGGAAAPRLPGASARGSSGRGSSSLPEAPAACLARARATMEARAGAVWVRTLGRKWTEARVLHIRDAAWVRAAGALQHLKNRYAAVFCLIENLRRKQRHREIKFDIQRTLQFAVADLWIVFV